MPEETPILTLGFVGDAVVHRANSLALLKDLVVGFTKQHRKAEVLIVLPDTPSTETHDDIEDWASTSGYFTEFEPPQYMVTKLLKADDARLILIGDPNEDDAVYAVAEEAGKYKIQTRSLINGLEKVVFDDDDLDPSEILEGFHEVDLDGDPDDDLAIDDDLAADPLAAPDLDVLADLADGGEVEAQEEIKEIAGKLDIDTTPFESWSDAVAAIRGTKTDDAEPDAVDRVLDRLAEVEEKEKVDPTPSSTPTSETGVSAPTPSSTTVEDVPPSAGEETDDEVADGVVGRVYSRGQLEGYDFPKVKAIALENGIPPGRGMKHGVLVNKILQAQGTEETAPTKPKAKKEKPTPPPVAAVPEPPTDIEEQAQQEAGATITPIRDVVSVEKTVADALRFAADLLDPPATIEV